jgi:hypothetical protein
MSTRSIAIAPHLKAELMQLSVTGPLRSLETGDCQSAAVRGQTEGFVWRFGAFLRECWRRMMIMHGQFEQAGDGARSRERGEERLREEQAWSRMDDEGCPNGRQQIDSPPETVGMARGAAADMQRCHL